MTIENFMINVSDSALADLSRRLDVTRWPDEIENSGWQAGTNLAYMKALATYWRDGFDWRRQEAALNALPNRRIALDGLRIHFVHERGKGPRPLPLIITHGWPGSFVEMVKLLPLLVDPAAHGASADDAFDVVVPSLPGYGFSDRPREPGMNPNRIAALWVRLMAELGYERFGAQGGDWGSAVSSALGLDHPDRIIGVHLNYIAGRFLLGGTLNQPQDDAVASQLPFTAACLVGQRRGLQPRASDETTDIELWPERLPCWSCRVDHREIPNLDRLRRRSEPCAHAR